MSKPILTVDNLHVDFTNAGKTTNAVKGVSFQLAKGETLALVGESGSGKSVTALSILQLLPYPTASHPKGSIKFHDTEMVGANETKLRNMRGDRISMIFQEPMTSLNPLHSIEKQIRETLFLHKGMDKTTARKKVLELLDLVGIRDPEKRLNSLPHELSGGQRQRVMIAMALANDPEILIADEPTTALDVTIQAQILQLLNDLQKKLNMAILFITHDLGIVQKIADNVAVMKDGEIVEFGETAKVFSNPSHDYTNHLINSEPNGTPPEIKDVNTKVMKARNMKVWFPIKKGIFNRVVDHIKAVDGIDFEIRKGETLGVVGESGSGKTTLGFAVLRLISSEGSIVYMGRELQGLKTKELRPLRRDLQIVFQDPFGSLSPRMTVEEIVTEGLQVHKIYKTRQERVKAVDQILLDVGLKPEHKNRYPHEFSGGQRQRISIARAVILQPKLIVLDEPTSALDRSVQSQIVDLLIDLQKKYNLSYLFISHDLKVVRALSHNVLVMKNGKVVERGTADQIFDKPENLYTKALMKAALNFEPDESDVVNL